MDNWKSFKLYRKFWGWNLTLPFRYWISWDRDVKRLYLCRDKDTYEVIFRYDFPVK